MADTILITASQRIERPAHEVRAQYRDIDHHIRNNVHPSIHYQWEPAPTGQRKIRTTFRILGVPQYDVSLLEDGEDGSFVIRYLEGSNAGMVLVHKFVPLADGATDVQLFADAPASVGRKLLGPLFVAGARQVMKKALAEDKRDLEGGAYVPDRAAGDVERAVASLADARSAPPADIRLLLEAACLVAAADQEVDAAERDALVRIVRLLGVEGRELGFVESKLVEFSKLNEGAQIADEVDRVGSGLQAAKLGKPGVLTAAVVGLVSHGLSTGELALLRRLALAASVDTSALAAMIDEADANLSARS